MVVPGDEIANAEGTSGLQHGSALLHQGCLASVGSYEQNLIDRAQIGIPAG